jgi:quinol monooxygenase YgiN
LVYETWKSQADLDAHFETPHLKALAKILAEMLEGEMKLTQWTKL